MNKQIGQNLRALRKNKGYSQSKLAKYLGITFQQIQKYENGSNRVSLETAIKVSNHFNISLDALTSGVPLNGESIDIPTFKEKVIIDCYRELSDAQRAALTVIATTMEAK